MKKYIFIFQTFCILLFSCKKGKGSNDTESQLIGNWNLVQKVIETPGQPTTTITHISFTNFCFIKFHDQPSSLRNLKFLEDNKDCSFGGGGWRLEGSNKLVLINLDTVYADILTLSTNSLVFKASPHTLAPNNQITYSFER